MKIIQVTITAAIGVTAIASAYTNFLLVRLDIVQRLLFAGGGILVIIPEIMTDLLGMGCLLAGVVLNFFARKRLRTQNTLVLSPVTVGEKLEKLKS